MKQAITLLLLLFISLQVATAQRHNAYDAGLGIRLGDPFGLSYKYYMQESKALEANLGSTYPGFYSGYFSTIFNDIEGYQRATYLGHSVNYSVSLQGRLLFHQDFPENIEGLEWYFGFGAQLRIIGVEYRYLDRENIRLTDSYSDVGFGPEGIVGAEYKIPDTQLTAFVDLSLFMEIVDNPLIFRLQAGLGMRYNFNFSY
jgi:hypothetical protein